MVLCCPEACGPTAQRMSCNAEGKKMKKKEITEQLRGEIFQWNSDKIGLLCSWGLNPSLRLILIWDWDLWFFGPHTHHLSHFFHCISRSLWLSWLAFWQVSSQTIFMLCSSFPGVIFCLHMSSLKQEEGIITFRCQFLATLCITTYSYCTSHESRTMGAIATTW